MGFLLGGQKTNSQQTPAVTGLQVQTSAYGKCVSFGFGTNRVPPQLIWYGHFVPHPQTTGGGGKGGGGGTGSTTYTYTTSVMFGLGEGPITGVRKVFIEKNVGASTAYPQVPYPGFTLFTGSYSQSPWSYLATLVTPQNGAFTRVAGGSYSGTRNYFIKCTFTSASGETLPNAEASFSVDDTHVSHLLKVAPPVSPPPGATGWNVYISLTTGTEKKQNVAAMGLTTGYTEPASGLVDHGSPPVTDTSKISQGLNYHGIAYLAAADYHLGRNPNLQNHNFEVQWSPTFGDDADPSQVVTSILTNTKYGTIFPSGNVGTMTTYQNYVYAANLFISPLYTEQRSAAEMLNEIAKMTNSGIVWSSGKLNFVPYGDTSLTANSHTYTAPSAPLYDLTDDDFLPNQASAGSAGSTSDDPVLLTRQDASQFYNSIRLEYLNRAKNYDPDIVEAKDQALIDTFGLHEDSNRDGHMFCDGTSAKNSVFLQLQREFIRNLYQFTLDQRYIGLDPMDIVSLTDSNLGLAQQWVRILEITENDDWSLTFIAEEYLQGTGNAALYDFESANGFNVDYNVDPGNTNAPVIFEAPAAITTNGGLETWISMSGGPLWGGADVYISTDNNNYMLVGTQVGPSRTGTLVDAIASGDTSMTVDLSQSYGQLVSGTTADAAAGNTLCYVDGEYISYVTATLISPYNYTLTGCVRGQYGSVAASHAAGKAFSRLDTQVFKYPHSKLQKGSALSIKLLSFNIYGGGQQTL